MFRSLSALLALVAVLAATAADAAGPLTRLATLPLGARAHDVVVAGDLAYVGTATGLAIVDVSVPSAPVLRGSLSTGRKTLGLVVDGGHAYLANQAGDLKVVDVSNPDAPALVASTALPGYAYDVALQDDILYVASFSGEIYLLDVSTPAAPRQIRVLGVPAWRAGDGDEPRLALLQAGTRAGNAKVTGLAVAGDLLFAVDWNYGRLYMWSIANPAAPVFAGTHYAAFTFRVEADPARDTAYAFAAFGASSGLFSVPISALAPDVSTSHATCAACDFFKSPATDDGGLALSATGRYAAYVAGKQGVLQILDVSNPSDIRNAGVISLGKFGVKSGDALGVAIRGEHVFVAAGALGFQVFAYPGLTD